MKTTILLILTMTLVSACSSLNYSKRCSDDVCVITEDGVTRYEGDPAKIAKIKAQKQHSANAASARNAAYKNAARRSEGEIIRVGIIPIDKEHGQFKNHANQFSQWITEAFAGDSRIELVDERKMRMHLSLVETKVPVARGFGTDGPREQSVVIPNEKTLLALRDLGITADVLVFTYLSSKTESGLVGGRGQGTGIASISRIEISGTVSSIYDFEAHRFSTMGKSAGTIDLAGYDKDGKAKSASIKNSKRNVSLDKPAAIKYANDIRSAIVSQIAPSLPSLAAVESARNQSNQSLTPTEANMLETMNKLNDLFSK